MVAVRKHPGVETPGYYRVVPLGRTQRVVAHSECRKGNLSRRNQMKVKQAQGAAVLVLVY